MSDILTYFVTEPEQSDYAGMVKLVEDFFNEQRKTGTPNRLFGLDLDTDKVYKWIKESDNRIDRFTRVVKTPTGQTVGGMAGHLSFYPFSDELIATDLLLYMQPKHVHAPSVFRMINEYVSWAEEVGAREAMLSTSTGFKTEQFGKLAEHKGFELAAVGYIRRLN